MRMHNNFAKKPKKIIGIKAINRVSDLVKSRGCKTDSRRSDLIERKRIID